MRTKSKQTIKPNKKAHSFTSNVGKHITDSESAQHQNEMRLSRIVVLANTHLRIADRQITKPNKEAPLYTLNVSNHMTYSDSTKFQIEVSLI